MLPWSMAPENGFHPSTIKTLVSEIEASADAFQAGTPGAVEDVLMYTTALQRAVEPAAQYVQRLRFEVNDYASMPFPLQRFG